MLLKKFSTSHHKFEELELEDQGEELYAISVGKAKSSGVEYNLTFAGETGKVLNIHLDSSLSFTGKTKQTILDFGAQVNCLQWTSDGKYLIVAGIHKGVLVFNYDNNSSAEYKGVDINSEVLGVSIDETDDHFCLSLKDGSVIIGSISQGNLFKKIQIGDIVKGNHQTNQTSFARNGDLYLPGKKTLQVAQRASDYELRNFDKIESQQQQIRGVLCLTGDKIAVYSDNSINIYTQDGKQQTSYPTNDASKQLAYCPFSDTIYSLNTEGGIFYHKNVTLAAKEQKNITPNEKHFVIDDEEIEQLILDEKKNLQTLKSTRFEGYLDEEAQVDDEEEDNSMNKFIRSNMLEKKKETSNLNKFQEHKMKNLSVPKSAMEEESVPKKRNNVVDETEDDFIPTEKEIITEDDDNDDNEVLLGKKIHSFNNTKSNILEDLGYLQTPFNVGSTTINGSRNYINWNLKGKIIVVNTAQFNHVEISYSLGELQATTVGNKLGFTMGDINWNGVLLASRGNYNINSYEDDFEEDAESSRNAKIFYLSSKGQKQWTISLKDHKEHILAAALGSSFSAVATDSNFIRFFSPLGLEFFIIGASQIVTLTAYENLLAIVYHGTLPFSGTQCLRVKLFDTSSLRVCLDTALIVSSRSELKWCGFSSNGILYVQDSNNTVWTLVNNHVWSCVYNSDSNLWVIGVQDNQIHGVKMGYGEIQPNPLAKLKEKAYDFEIPLQTPDYQGLAQSQIQREQSIFLKEFWGHYAGITTGQDVDNYERTLMPNEASLKKDEKKRDAEIAKLITKRSDLGQDDEILWLAMQIVTPQVFEVVCSWLRQNDKMVLESKIRDYYPTFNSSNYLDRERNKIVIIKEKIEVRVKENPQVD